MFFLFGWGHQTRKDYGPTFPMMCPNCNNNSFWKLLHQRVWFTLFFIPVFPYKSNHYLLCEICSRGMELKGPQIDQAKSLNVATAAYLNKQTSEEQYKLALDQAKMLE